MFVKMSSLARAVTLVVAATGLALSAQAQVGTGWSSTSVNYKTQISSGCSISGSTFIIDGGSGRAERRYDTLTSGSRQFQGTFKVNSLGGDRVSVFQTFSETYGPKQMGAVEKSTNRLYEVHGGATLASYSVGSSMRINTTATSGGTVEVYVNGSKKGTTTGANNPYNKIGSYATASGAGPCSTTWSSIAFWRK